MDRQKLVEENLKLVYEVAHKYKYLCCTTVDFEDLVSIGYIGLIKASKAYDDTKNIKFSTLAFVCIKNAILREFVNKQYKFNDTNTVSLNSNINTGSAVVENIELAEIIRDDKMDDYLENLDNKILIDSIYEKCTAREKKIIDMFLEGYSLREIAPVVGCHHITVSKVINNLKRYIGGGMSMKLDDTETVCPYCFGKLGDDINKNVHIKYCADCGKWWETYTEEEN